MNLATNAYGLIALGVVGIALQMARKNTGPGQKPKDIAARIALFITLFGFFVYVVPLLFNAGVVHVFNQTQNSAAGQIVGATLNNSAGMMQALVGGEVTLPEVDTVAPVLPDSDVLPKVAPAVPITPRREPQVERVPQVQRATVSAPSAPQSAPAAAPAARRQHLAIDPTTPKDDGLRILQERGATIISWPSAGDHKVIDPTSPDGGPSAADADAAVISQYTVKRGDTMHKIAQWWYGDGEQWTVICKANPMRDCDNLRAGMVLNLP